MALFLCMLASRLLSQEIQFQQLNDAGVLNTGAIFCILQDRVGFLWFGTEYGLYRYDGNDYRIYRNNPDDPASLSDNTIWTLFEDREGSIWIGTANGGVNRLDPHTEKFSSWRATESNATTGPGLSDNSINAITQDRDGIIWIGTYKGGLNRFNPQTGEFYHWFRDDSNPGTLSSFYVTSLLIDYQNRLWIAYQMLQV